MEVDPRHLVREMEKIIKATFPKGIRLTVRIAGERSNLKGDTTQLHQVLLNLCVNARDAMNGKGDLTLECECMAVDEAAARKLRRGMAGDYVVLRVRDTGSGIPPAIMERIFDPFFTTKGPELGTGLGLSTVSGIVENHGGFLHVDSTPGEGSVFSAYLPALSESGGIISLEKGAGDWEGHGELVLVVDDEPTIREMSRCVLENLHLRSIDAEDGEEALLKIADCQTEICAVITDLHMPHMDGLNFVKSLRTLLPVVPVILASGHLDSGDLDEFKSLGVETFLSKPFTRGEMSEKLRQVLLPV
ncbi:MAG: ATP-binding protein [Chthoniobacteraceae bacterium]